MVEGAMVKQYLIPLIPSAVAALFCRRFHLPAPSPLPPNPTKKMVDPMARKPTTICDPYEQGGKPLSPSDAASLVATLHPDWSLSEDSTKLMREFKAEDWSEGLRLMNTLANVAGNNDHYPVLGIERRLGRKKWTTVVKCELCTRVLGGLSYRDFELGLYIDTEVERE